MARAMRHRGRPPWRGGKLDGLKGIGGVDFRQCEHGSCAGWTPIGVKIEHQSGEQARHWLGGHMRSLLDSDEGVLPHGQEDVG